MGLKARKIHVWTSNPEPQGTEKQLKVNVVGINGKDRYSSYFQQAIVKNVLKYFKILYNINF